MAKRITYRAPRNAAERVAEARAAIVRLESSSKACIANRVGQAGAEHARAIAGWHAVITRETHGKGV